MILFPSAEVIAEEIAVDLESRGITRAEQLGIITKVTRIVAEEMVTLLQEVYGDLLI